MEGTGMGDEKMWVNNMGEHCAMHYFCESGNVFSLEEEVPVTV